MKYRISTSNERVWCTTQLAKLSFNHSIGRTHSWRFWTYFKIVVQSAVSSQQKKHRAQRTEPERRERRAQNTAHRAQAEEGINVSHYSSHRLCGIHMPGGPGRKEDVRVETTSISNYWTNWSRCNNSFLFMYSTHNLYVLLETNASETGPGCNVRRSQYE